MGVVYKLETKIKDYILELKRSNPSLSCRKITALILDKFKLEISKSSVNSIIKEAGLSSSIGRRLKKKRHKPDKPTLLLEDKVEPLKNLPQVSSENLIEKPIEKPLEVIPEAQVEKPHEEVAAKPIEVPVDKPVEKPIPVEAYSTGAILLKAADSLLGGSYYISDAIKGRFLPNNLEALAKIEPLLYGDLFGWNANEALPYLNALQQVKGLPSEILTTMSNQFQEVRFLKVILSDNAEFYLDGQLYTVWSTPHIPFDFSATIYNIKGYINKFLTENVPLVLFSAAGYEVPTKEFFDLISGIAAEEKRISRFTLYNNKLKELEVIPFARASKRLLVFGLWPWQFVQYRKVKSIGEFRPFTFAPLKENLYLANIEIELTQPNVNKRVTLTGCALKKTPNEKTFLVVLSNLLPKEARYEEVVNIYLNRWPNLEEAFGDYSRKIEFFTYTASSQRFFSTENLPLEKNSSLDIKGLFADYLQVLNAYVQWHFLPFGYEDKGFATINERFYSLKTLVKREEGQTSVIFQPPKNYAFLKELLYACRRLNEREVSFFGGGKAWFKVLENAF